MNNKFAVFDIDGTLFRGSLYVELGYELLDMGIINDSAFRDSIDELSELWKRRSDQHAYDTFDQMMSLGIDTRLKGVNIDEYHKAVDTVVAKHAHRTYVYTRELAKRLKEEGYTLIAISGSPQAIVERFAEQYGFDICIGHTKLEENGVLTGEVVPTHTRKAAHLKKLVKEHCLSYSDSVAIGDTVSDAPLLDMVEHAYAFNPTQELIDLAHNKSQWNIVIERKNIAYVLRQAQQPGGSFVLDSYQKV